MEVAGGERYDRGTGTGTDADADALKLAILNDSMTRILDTYLNTTGGTPESARADQKKALLAPEFSRMCALAGLQMETASVILFSHVQKVFAKEAKEVKEVKEADEAHRLRILPQARLLVRLKYFQRKIDGYGMLERCYKFVKAVAISEYLQNKETTAKRADGLMISASSTTENLARQGQVPGAPMVDDVEYKASEEIKRNPSYNNLAMFRYLVGGTGNEKHVLAQTDIVNWRGTREELLEEVHTMLSLALKLATGLKKVREKHKQALIGRLKVLAKKQKVDFNQKKLESYLGDQGGDTCVNGDEELTLDYGCNRKNSTNGRYRFQLVGAVTLFNPPPEQFNVFVKGLNNIFNGQGGGAFREVEVKLTRPDVTEKSVPGGKRAISLLEGPFKKILDHLIAFRGPVPLLD